MNILFSRGRPSLLITYFRQHSSRFTRRAPTHLRGHFSSTPFVILANFCCVKLALDSLCSFRFLAAAASTDKDENMTDVSEIIKQADELYNANKFQEVFDHLVKHKQSDSVEVLWRLARATIDVGKMSSDKEFRKGKIYEGAEIMERAMKIDTNNAYVHKWHAFSIKYTGEYEGTKKQIQNSYKIKEHLDRAAELNPKDATVQYALGTWAFTFADMGWMTRKLAATIFDNPPAATYEESLAFFEKAEDLNPNGFSLNLLMIGKVYNGMGNKEKAIEYLRRARDYSPKVTVDDRDAHDEATQLLAKLGVKN